RALVHVGSGGDGRARPGRPLRSHRLRQGTGGQDEDSLAAGRAAQGLVSAGPLASQSVAQRTDHAVVLNLGDGGCPQPFEQAASPAKQIQEPPLPANPRGLHTAPRISQGVFGREFVSRGGDNCPNYRKWHATGQRHWWVEGCGGCTSAFARAGGRGKSSM